MALFSWVLSSHSKALIVTCRVVPFLPEMFVEKAWEGGDWARGHVRGKQGDLWSSGAARDRLTGRHSLLT